MQRKRKYSLRAVLNGIFYVLRTGCQWRNLRTQRDIPWQSVYYYFYRWTKQGLIQEINRMLNTHIRLQQEKAATPSLCCADSQSIKIAPMIKNAKGIDGNKKVNGRKRQLLVDTTGLIWAVFVHAANFSDSVMGCHLFSMAKGKLTRLKKILVDAGYRGLFTDLAAEYLQVKAEISSRPPTEKGFVPVAKRWVNERTFGWLNFFRRLSKDYERSARSAESMILLANCAQ